MMNLFVAEMKKLFRSWPNRIVLLFVFVFPILNMEFSMITEQGNHRIEKDAIREELKGTIDETWLDQRVKEIEAMEEAGVSEYDLRYTTIKEAYWDGLRAYENSVLARTDPSAPEIVRNDFLNILIQAGPYEDWFLLFENLSASGFVYAIACIYLFCNLFNQEEESGAVDLIKSSRKGRIRLALAKVGLCLSVCITLGLLVCLLVSIVARMHLSLPGSDTSLFMVKKPQYLTCGIVEKYYIVIILLSGCICGISSTWLSSLSKKMYVSLSFGILLFILPALIPLPFFDSALEMFFPISFAVISRSFIYYPWLNIGNLFQHNITMLSYIWILVLSIVIIHTIWNYCKYKDILPIRKLRSYRWN